MSRTFAPGQKKVIFFDINRTLVDPEQSFRLHFRELLDEWTARWSDRQENWNAEKVLKQFEREWNSRRKKRFRDRRKKRAVQMRCLQKALSPYPFDPGESFLNTFFQELQTRQQEKPVLYADVVPTLRQLSKRYRLAVISNNRHFHVRKLGIQSWIPEEHLFTARNQGFGKPHPAFFKAALKKMEIRSHEGIMVGDSWKRDILGAVRCGMDAVWIRRGGKGNKKVSPPSGKKVIVIHRLQDLLEHC